MRKKTYTKANEELLSENETSIIEEDINEMAKIGKPTTSKIEANKQLRPRKEEKKELNKKIDSHSLVKETSIKPKKSLVEDTKKEIPIRTCEQCSKEAKVKLICGHTLCTKCILKYVISKFGDDKTYNYEAICNKCNKTIKLGSFIFNSVGAIILDCKCKCKWTDFRKTILCKFDICIIFNSIIDRVEYGKCSNNEKISSTDSYLINDYNWYKQVYDTLNEEMQSSRDILTILNSK